MLIKTRDFGEIEIIEGDIITFDGAIFGFEGYRRFVFLYEAEISEHFVWLQSIEDPALCFIVINPALVSEQYAPALPPEIHELLGTGDYMLWLLVVVREDFASSTVNFKSPIVVNITTKRAAQAILEADYPVNHLLLGGKGGE